MPIFYWFFFWLYATNKRHEKGRRRYLSARQNPFDKFENRALQKLKAANFRKKRSIVPWRRKIAENKPYRLLFYRFFALKTPLPSPKKITGSEKNKRSTQKPKTTAAAFSRLFVELKIKRQRTTESAENWVRRFFVLHEYSSYLPQNQPKTPHFKRFLRLFYLLYSLFHKYQLRIN